MEDADSVQAAALATMVGAAYGWRGVLAAVAVEAEAVEAEAVGAEAVGAEAVEAETLAVAVVGESSATIWRRRLT